MLTKKKLGGLAVTIAASALMLGACNTVEARPTDAEYYQNILNLKDIVNNQMKEIYDAVVVPGDTNSETVLNNVLYRYATTMFGNFYGEEGAASLKNAVLGNDETMLQAIADTYEVYGGNAEKVKAMYRSIVMRLEEVFLGYVQDETYQNRKVFEEEEFYDARIAEYYDLPEVESTDFNRKLVDGSIRLEEGTLGVDDTLVGTNGYFGNILDRYQPYIEVAVLPTIYRSLLTSQYLIEENYRALGLSYARKVDIINLANNSDPNYVYATRNLMDAYSDLVINGGYEEDNAGTTVDANTYGFEFLSSLYKGTYDAGSDATGAALAEAIYEQADWTTGTISSDPLDPDGGETTYYHESSLGKIYDDYLKLTESRYSDDDTIRNDFTGNGAYAPEIGFMIKYQDLVAESHTTHGWYTSTGLPSDTIPSAMQTRLFRMNVANEVDFNLTEDGDAYVDDLDMDYGWYRGGNYYLVPANYESGDETPYVVTDAGNWYIVKVDEAVKTAKLSETNDQSYANMPKHSDDALYLDNIAREVAYTLSSNDTYVSSANQYYVEQMAISFHDDDVYDYFKSTFAGLFND